jgi:hypothetical protein
VIPAPEVETANGDSSAIIDWLLEKRARNAARPND